MLNDCQQFCKILLNNFHFCVIVFLGDNKMTIYERIRDLRIQQKLSQDDLAKALGYKDRSMITKIESGKVDISQTKIIDFARVLHTTPAYLMGWEDNNPGLSFDEQAIIDIYRSLPEKGKEHVRASVQAAKLLFGEKSQVLSAKDAIRGL